MGRYFRATNKEWQQMNERFDIVAFGEILWDVIDGVPHLGGAPFNFAAHAARCGLKSAIVSAVGDDELGRRAQEAASGFGVDTSGVSVHPNLPTGTVNVTLADGIPSYEIVRPVAWDEITGGACPVTTGNTAADATERVPPRAFYFGTLAQRPDVQIFARLLRCESAPGLLGRGGCREGIGAHRHSQSERRRDAAAGICARTAVRPLHASEDGGRDARGGGVPRHVADGRGV